MSDFPVFSVETHSSKHLFLETLTSEYAVCPPASSASHDWAPAIPAVAQTHTGIHLCSNSVLESHLCCITHIALNIFSNDVQFCATLRSLTTLLCTVVLVLNPIETADIHPLADDRFSYRVDSLRGADTSDDYWAVADAFIAVRSAGEVEAESTQYIISDTSWNFFTLPPSRCQTLPLWNMLTSNKALEPMLIVAYTIDSTSSTIRV
ncbi:hypothetical protein MVEN_00735000 [Mycena venus]|uniref:Uncharacterized protein n=1 Tax=Mycena venus TaxID=2733690 RepID=A0A8H7D2V1_9AGAR|nr:hypothetical protein MVEN_00735000 [Mycena venus]